MSTIIWCGQEKEFATIQAGLPYLEDGHKIWDDECSSCENTVDPDRLEESNHFDGPAYVRTLELYQSTLVKIRGLTQSATGKDISESFWQTISELLFEAIGDDGE